MSEWALENRRSLDIAEDTGLQKLAAIFVEIGANFGHHINVDELFPKAHAMHSNVDDYYQDRLEKVRLDTV